VSRDKEFIEKTAENTEIDVRESEIVSNNLVVSDNVKESEVVSKNPVKDSEIVGVNPVCSSEGDVEYIIVNFQSIAALVSNIQCPQCRNAMLSLTKSPVNNSKLVFLLVLNCELCGYMLSEITSPKVYIHS